MATEIRLPQWAMGLQDGIVSEWFIAEGDKVEAGQEIAEIDEAKVTDVISAPEAGYIIKILIPEGKTVPVRTTLCLLGSLEELNAQTEAPGESTESAGETKSAAQPASRVQPNTNKPVQVTPIARKLAKEFNLDLTQIRGSGPGGRILEEDVRQARETAPAEFEGVEIQLSGVRAVVAQRMAESLQNSAQFTMTMTADVTSLFEQYKALNEAGADGVKITFTDVIVKSTAEVLKKHPKLNGWLQDEKIHLPKQIHIGLAVALEEGLIVPVLRDANDKNLLQIARETKALVQKAREKKLGTEEISGSTFSITNLGMFGVDFFTPIINLPEIAILGIGGVSNAPTEENDSLAWRKILPLSLTVDHRAVDGAPAAEFLRDLKTYFETADLKVL